jgi:hypothetical protein
MAMSEQRRFERHAIMFEISRMRGELARAVRANADQAEIERIE